MTTSTLPMPSKRSYSMHSRDWSKCLIKGIAGTIWSIYRFCFGLSAPTSLFIDHKSLLRLSESFMGAETFHGSCELEGKALFLSCNHLRRFWLTHSPRAPRFPKTSARTPRGNPGFPRPSGAVDSPVLMKSFPAEVVLV
jgi:hypothetical protein